MANDKHYPKKGKPKGKTSMKKQQNNFTRGWGASSRPFDCSAIYFGSLTGLQFRGCPVHIWQHRQPQHRARISHGDDDAVQRQRACGRGIEGATLLAARNCTTRPAEHGAPPAASTPHAVHTATMQSGQVLVAGDSTAVTMSSAELLIRPVGHGRRPATLPPPATITRRRCSLRAGAGGGGI